MRLLPQQPNGNHLPGLSLHRTLIRSLCSMIGRLSKNGNLTTSVPRPTKLLFGALPNLKCPSRRRFTERLYGSWEKCQELILPNTLETNTSIWLKSVEVAKCPIIFPITTRISATERNHLRYATVTWHATNEINYSWNKNVQYITECAVVHHNRISVLGDRGKNRV